MQVKARIEKYRTRDRACRMHVQKELYSLELPMDLYIYTLGIL